jgi:hypothetical protein
MVSGLNVKVAFCPTSTWKLAPAAEETATVRATTTVESHDIARMQIETRNFQNLTGEVQPFCLWRMVGDVKRRESSKGLGLFLATLIL